MIPMIHTGNGNGNAFIKYFEALDDFIRVWFHQLLFH